MVVHEVEKLLSDIIGVEADEIVATTTLSKRNGVEPLDVAKLIIACEKKFKLTIHDEDVHTFLCIGDLAAYIDQKLSEGYADTPEITDEDRVAWYYE